MMVNVNDFIQEKSCTYKGEFYSVRDNGAVMRQTPEGKKARPLDNVWTFGKKNESNGYMTIGGHRVHIIVAIAFHGLRDSKVYVVDHIDTNRCNNRPENLRWLTRLENILLNDITRQKIEWICGSVENFLKNPSLLRGHEFEDCNFEWMRTVTKEEAENTLYSWRSLKEKPKAKSDNKEPIGDWIFDKAKCFFSELLPEEKTPEQIKEERLANEKRLEELILQQEKEKIQKKEQKRHEYNERAKQKRAQISFLRNSIVTVAKAHSWTIEKNVTGNGWKADLVIVGPENRIGISFYKTIKDIQAERAAMLAEGIIDCWLECTLQGNECSDLLPCFNTEITESSVNVIFSDGQNVSLDELFYAMMLNRLKIEEFISVKKVNVRFVPTTCYICGTKHYIYFVQDIIREDTHSLIFYGDLLCEPDVSIRAFTPIVIRSVKRFLFEHPELKYNMGEIKERFSRTMNEKYLSFGCPKCDGLVGNHYLNEYMIDAYYDCSNEDVHVIDLEEPGLTLSYKHWVIL